MAIFIFIFQSLTSLLLLGVLAYFAFTSIWLKDRCLTRNAVIGFIFGLIAISLSIGAIPLDLRVYPFDAIAGPLIFAGYLGGPIGAAIAGGVAALYRYLGGGSGAQVGVILDLAIPLAGAVISYIRPIKNWPTIPRSALIHLIILFLLIQFVPNFMLNGMEAGLNPGRAMLALFIGFSISGVVSILITCKILNVTHVFAETANQSRHLSKKLELALKASGTGIFEHQRGDPGPIFDERLSSMYGLREGAGPIVFDTLEPLIHPDDLEHMSESIRESWEGNQSQGSFDFRAYRLDGSLRFFHVQWIVERESEGKISRVLGLQSDLTDIRLAMEREREANNRLGLIVEKIPGVLLEMGGPIRGQPEVIFVSPKCFDIWGVTAQEFYADPTLFFQMHDPEDVQAFAKAIETSIDLGAPISRRYKIFARNGQARWLDFRGSAVVDDGQIIVKSVAIDVTDEVETQQQLEREKEISRQAQKLESIGRLTGGVAHDFNNLLGIILANLELLNSGDDAAHHDEFIDAAITATMRGADLTKSMLAFARKAPLAPEILDINCVLENARTWMARAVPPSIVVETSLSSNLWPVAADRASLEGALLNLILNACDAMDGQGILTIETANEKFENDEVDAVQNVVTRGEYVVVTVSDTGTGISQEHLNAIFDPFFTTKAPGAGSGIGLSMTMGFMEQTGGAIHVQSRLGEGSSFKLYFPTFGEKVDAPSPAVAVKSTVEVEGKENLTYRR